MQGFKQASKCKLKSRQTVQIAATGFNIYLQDTLESILEPMQIILQK